MCNCTKKSQKHSDIVFSLLFRIEEACVHLAGRIKFLSNDYNEITTLQKLGYIKDCYELLNNTHDHCTHRVSLTDTGWIAASKLRKQLSDLQYNHYKEVERDAKSFELELNGELYV